MKKAIKTLMVVGIFVLFSIQNVSAQEAFTIRQAHVEMEVHEDGSLDVEETFQLNFDEERHGMYRYIPNSYSMSMVDNGEASTKKYYFPVSDVKCSTTCEIMGNKDGVNIKLGDKDAYVIGPQSYTISYHVQTKDLRLKSKSQALYWNLLSGFDTQTYHLSYRITMPKSFDSKQVYTYTGAYGQNGDSLSARVKGNIIEGELDGFLYNNESATIRVNLPNDYFKFPTIKDHTLLVALISTALALLSILFFIKFGKDDEVIITVEFNAPKGLNSADAGFILDDTAQNKDIISLIIDWANRGFLKIYDKKEGFALEKLRDMYNNNSKPYEQEFFKAIFAEKELVNEQDLKDQKVGEALAKSKRMLTSYFHNSLRNRIYQNSSIFLQVLMSFLMMIPTGLSICLAGHENFGLISIYGAYLIPTLLLGFSGIAWFFLMRYRYVLKKGIFQLLAIICFIFDLLLLCLSVLMQSIVGVSLWGMIVSVLTTLVMLTTMIFMDKRTKQGNQWLGQLLGFKEFIISCEKEQLEMLVEDNPSVFYHILPYAYVMGISDVWVKKFELISIPSPDWYDGYQGSVFTSVLWWNHFHYCFTNISTASSYIPQGSGGGSFGSGGFGGGGFSGGGFGGGGGGSW